MRCGRVVFSGRALRRMFERDLTTEGVVEVIERGEIIAEYPDDRPYPSFLLLGTAAGAPIHVVVARDPEDGICFVVTAYNPDPDLWTDDFRARK